MSPLHYDILNRVIRFLLRWDLEDDWREFFKIVDFLSQEFLTRLLGDQNYCDLAVLAISCEAIESVFDCLLSALLHNSMLTLIDDEIVGLPLDISIANTSKQKPCNSILHISVHTSSPMMATNLFP